jgi:hypothetical protein
MMIRRTGLILAAAALAAVAGCNKKKDETAAPSAESPAAQAPAASTATTGAPTPPKRKPGLWEQTMAMSGMTQTSRLCVDATVEEKLGWWSQQATKNMCSQQSFAPGPGGTWTFSSTCSMGSGGTTVTKGVASGDFSSAYQLDMTSTTTGAGAPQMNGEHKMTMKATWKGPCPADMRPGDMLLSAGGQGVKMNLLDGLGSK